MRVVWFVMLLGTGCAEPKPAPRSPAPASCHAVPPASDAAERSDIPQPMELPAAAVPTQRLSGEVEKADEQTRTELRAAGLTRVSAAFKICVDPEGVPMRVTLRSSSCSTRYDDALAVQLETFRYRPYIEDGVPVPFCTAMSIDYPL